MTSASTAAPPSCPLSLRHIFGLKGDVRSNLHYLDEQHIVYPAGYNIVLYNIDKKTQRFLPLTPLPPPQQPAAAANAAAASSAPSVTADDVSSEITCLALSAPKHSHAKGKLLAVAEQRAVPVSASASFSAFARLLISIYDLSSMKRKGKYSLPITTETGAVVSLAFSPDSKTLLSLTAPPNPTLTLWSWEKGKAITSTLVPSPAFSSSFFLTQPAAAASSCSSLCSFCPTDPSVVCLSGPGVLRFLHLEQNEFRSIPFSMTKQHDNIVTAAALALSATTAALTSSHAAASSSSSDYTCHAWLDDRLVVATREGDLHLFENAEYRGILAGSPSFTSSASSGGSAVSALASLSKGFLCGYGDGQLALFERDEKDIYKQSKLYAIRKAAEDEDDERRGEEEDEDEDIAQRVTAVITNIALAPTEDAVILSLACNESFHLSLLSASDALSLSALSGQKSRREKERMEQVAMSGIAAAAAAASSALSPLFDSLSLSHSSSITSVSICVRKPFLLTTSTDRSVRVWNYLTRSLEFSTAFASTPLCCSFHPSGYYVLLSFPSHLRLCSLYLDDFHTCKTYGHRSARVVKFSRGGAYFAVAADCVLHCYDAYRGTQLLMCNKHKAEIMDVAFTDNDSELVSVSKDGQLYRSFVHPATQTAAVAAAHSGSASSGSVSGSDGSSLLGKYKCLFSRLVMCGDNYYLASNEPVVKLISLSSSADSSGAGSTGVVSSASGSLQSASALRRLSGDGNPSMTDIVIGQEVTALALLHHLQSTSASSSSSSSFSSSSSLRERTLIVGTDSGSLKLVPLPYDAANPRISSLQLFHSRVTAFALNLDQSLLFVVSDDACLAIVDVERRSVASAAAGGEEKKASTALLSFSEESLVAASSLTEQQRLLSHLQSSIVQLSSQHAALLSELEAAYKKKLKEMSDRYEKEIETDKHKYRLEEEEKQRIERQYAEREAEIRQLMQRRKTELHDAHAAKLSLERERYQELQARQQETQREQAEQVERRRQQHEKEKAEYAARQQEALLRLQEAESAALQQRAEIIAEFETHRELMEADVESEMTEWKLLYAHKLIAEKAATASMKEQHAAIRAEFAAVKAELTHNHGLLQQHYTHYSALSLQLSQHQLSLSTLEKENNERQLSISEKLHRQFELKKKNQELEKFRFVLDYKIAELKRMIAPKRNERLRLKEEMSVMDSEVDLYAKDRETMQLVVRDMKMKTHGLKAEEQRQRKAERDARRVLNLMRLELGELAKKADKKATTKELQTELRRLYDKYVLAVNIRAAGGDGSDDNENAEQSLYGSHVSALEKRVDAYVSKLRSDAELVCKEERKRRQENIQLTLQVNAMRKERAASMRRAGGGAGTDSKDEEKTGSSSSSSGGSRQRLDEEKAERERNVEARKRAMQQEEIAYQAEIIKQLTEELRVAEEKLTPAADEKQQSDAEDSSTEEQQEHEHEEQQQQEEEKVQVEAEAGSISPQSAAAADVSIEE